MDTERLTKATMPENPVEWPNRGPRRQAAINPEGGGQAIISIMENLEGRLWHGIASR